MAVCTFATLADPAERERRVLATLPFLYFHFLSAEVRRPRRRTARVRSGAVKSGGPHARRTRCVLSNVPGREVRENQSPRASKAASSFLQKAYEAVGHVVGRLSKKYYFEDFVRVYPNGQGFLPLGLKRRPTRNSVNNYLNHVKFYRFAAQIVSGRRVADVGCGSGYGSEILSKAGAVRVRGCDASRSAIAFAQSHYGAFADFSIQKVTDLSQYADDSFDVSISNEVLEHVKEYGKEAEVIAEMRRVTRSNGLVIIGTPNAEMMPDHGFSFEEIQSLVEKNFQKYLIFENALVPPGGARSLWEKRVAEGRVGITIAERINLAETVWLDPGPPEVKVGIPPGRMDFAGDAFSTDLLHNTHSWVVIALNEKVGAGLARASACSLSN